MYFELVAARYCTCILCSLFLLQQGQKLLKKESDVGMLLTGMHVGMVLTGIQHRNKLHVHVGMVLIYKAQRQAACGAAAYWFTEHKQAACRMSSRKPV